MKKQKNYFTALQEELIKAAEQQDRYDLNTINLIAPASPTPMKYFHNLPLKHNAIAEGLLENRPYAGVEGFNRIEKIAAEAACALFEAEHANVQPHSVSQANQAVYQALLNYGDRALAMRFDAGGHLTHGMTRNFSGIFYNFEFYGVNKDGWLDYEEVKRKAQEFKPKLIVCGASSYPRVIDFDKLAMIAKKTGAYLMADLSHPAGLIVANRFPKPFPHCDVVTLTLDKTMLGPHGGIVLCKNELSQQIDKAIHPGVQSSIPLRRIYQIAQCLIDSSSLWFNDYIDRVIRNMKVLEQKFNQYPDLIITGGSDTHLMVLNTYKVFGLTGKEAEEILENLGILTNRQVVPGETLKPYIASGIRLGTSWITARGYSEEETEIIADIILKNLADPTNIPLQETSKSRLKELLKIKRKNDVWYE
jgi:glycine hydroxymethyltransferase